jgi:hypothetical protein
MKHNSSTRTGGSISIDADEVKAIKAVFAKAMSGELDGVIVEVCYDDNMKPYPLRIRADKTFPNVFNTCLTNFENRL